MIYINRYHQWFDPITKNSSHTTELTNQQIEICQKYSGRKLDYRKSVNNCFNLICILSYWLVRYRDRPCAKGYFITFDVKYPHISFVAKKCVYIQVWWVVSPMWYPKQAPLITQFENISYIHKCSISIRKPQYIRSGNISNLNSKTSRTIS